MKNHDAEIMGSEKNPRKRRRILSSLAADQSSDTTKGDDYKKKLRSWEPTSRPTTTFYSLPTEIRNTIYRYVFLDWWWYPINWESNNPKRNLNAIPTSSPSLLHTSRRIQEECSAMYYGNCLVTVRSGPSLRNFVADHQPAHVQMIRDLRILQQSQSTCADFGIILGNDLTRDRKSVYPKLIQQPSDVSVLSSFQGLEELHLELDAFEDVSNILPIAHRGSLDVAKAIFDVAKDMGCLNVVTCLTIVPRLMDIPWGGSNVHPNDIPGWIYTSRVGGNLSIGGHFKHWRLEMFKRSH